jgi:hypothetical protein
VIPTLIGLRAAIDRALEALEPLVPVLQAWTGTAQKEVPGDAAVPPRPPTAANGAEAPGRPPRGPQEASCPECGAAFVKHGRQVFCTPRCRGRAGERRRRHEREAAAEPVPDQIERPLRVPEHERSSDLAALAPPPLPWDARH